MSYSEYSAPRGVVCDVCHARLDLTTAIALYLDEPMEYRADRYRQQLVRGALTVTELPDPKSFRSVDDVAAQRGWSCYVGRRQRRHYCPTCTSKPKSPNMQKVW